MTVPKIDIGGRSIPSGYLIGRVSPGTGRQELLTIADVARQMVRLNIVPAPGAAASLSPIADDKVLANVSGSAAAPTATGLTQPAAGFTITGDTGTSAFLFVLADDLAAVEGLGTNGMAARTATSTWTTRTITGTANRIAMTNGDGVAGNPTINISANYVGQATITTLGTIATGVWNGTTILGQYGGTGVANTGKTITLGGSLTTSGAFDTTFTVTAGTSVTLPTTGTLATLAGTETLTNKTIDAGVLTGATTLPGSGQIDASGKIGILTTPDVLLDLSGTFTTAEANIVQLDTTIVSSVTTTQRGLSIGPVFEPSGASLSQIFGMTFVPTINNAAMNLTLMVGLAPQIVSGAGYTGTISTAAAVNVANPSAGGTNPFTTYVAYRTDTNTHGNGLASGTVTNIGILIPSTTSASAGGTLNNRSAEFRVPSGGSTSGTTNNRGVYITGNGGTAAGGTVNNFAIFSDSTAPSQLGTGILSFGGVTSSFPALKRSGTNLLHRLADDSAYAPASASAWHQHGGETGQFAAFKSLTELTTIAAAATTDTTITIPANALVYAVSVRVTTVIPTAATFDWGIAGATTRYGTGASTAANTTSPGTLDAMRYYAAATAIRITPNATPAADTGRVRVTIHYIEVTPPTS